MKQTNINIDEIKAQEWQEFLDREAEKQNSFAEGMRVTVPAASLTDGEAFVIVTIRRKAADNGGNASLTVKSETRGKEYNVNGSDVRDILPPFFDEQSGKAEREPASEITEADAEKAFNEALTINVGDRVTSKYYHTIGTVTRIRQEKGQTLYDVKFDKPVKSFWGDEMKDTGDFCRYAITKDYDPVTGCEREGTAIYYAEELQADYWQSEPRTIFDIEIYKPTARRPTWLVVADIFSEPKQATLYEICDYLAALYQENHKAA